MKVICKNDKGAAVPADIRKDNFSSDTIFPVIIGKTYNVYAMGQRVGSSLLEYLICDELGLPFFCPSHLFNITESSLPSNWGYTEWIRPGFHYRIWGYKEILDYDHNDGISERRKADMKIFTKARKTIDDRTWFDGELEVIAKLSQLNGLADIDCNIDSRVRSDSSLRTMFIGSITLDHSKDSPNDFQTVSVILNDGECEGECMLLIEGKKIVGIEVFLIDCCIPSTIRNIKVKT